MNKIISPFNQKSFSLKTITITSRTRSNANKIGKNFHPLRISNNHNIKKNIISSYKQK